MYFDIVLVHVLKKCLSLAHVSTFEYIQALLMNRILPNRIDE